MYIIGARQRRSAAPASEIALTRSSRKRHVANDARKRRELFGRKKRTNFPVTPQASAVMMAAAIQYG